MRKSSRRKKVSSSQFESEISDDLETNTQIKDPPRKVYPTTVISINWDALSSRRKLNSEIRDEITDLYYTIQKGAGKSLISKINELLEGYSDLPILFNMLEIAYRIDDEEEKANEVALQLIKKFPDTLFAKISQIGIYLSRGEIENATNYLDGKFEFLALYPERANFHIQEIISFHFMIGKYFALANQIEKANNSLESIKAIDEEHIFNKILSKIIDKNSGLKFYQRVLKKLK